MQSRKQIPNIKNISRYCYYICLVLGVLAALMGVVIKVCDINVYKILPHCYFHKMFGYYCFGCGGTRAIVALTQGKLIESFLYHPFVIYTFVVYLSFVISNILNRITKGKIHAFLFHPVVFYVGAAIVVIQCIVKNCILYVNGSCI